MQCVRIIVGSWHYGLSQVVLVSLKKEVLHRPLLLLFTITGLNLFLVSHGLVFAFIVVARNCDTVLHLSLPLEVIHGARLLL